MVLCFSAMALAAQPAAAPPAIPAGAVKAGDGYHYTDPQGCEWVYRPTPFGVARIPATDSGPAVCGRPAAKAAATVPEDNIRATDHGDTVSFERPGPFGVYRWERKKADMDAGERTAWQREMTAAGDRK
jgi:hypothetical protein